MTGWELVLTPDEEMRRWWLALPPLAITWREMASLPEYSATRPTGVVIGKTWRREEGAWDARYTRQGGKPRWVICRYEEAPAEMRRVPSKEKLGEWEMKSVEMAKTVTYRPVIRVKMGRTA